MPVMASKLLLKNSQNKIKMLNRTPSSPSLTRTSSTSSLDSPELPFTPPLTQDPTESPLQGNRSHLSPNTSHRTINTVGDAHGATSREIFQESRVSSSREAGPPSTLRQALLGDIDIVIPPLLRSVLDDMSDYTSDDTSDNEEHHHLVTLSDTPMLHRILNDGNNDPGDAQAEAIRATNYNKVASVLEDINRGHAQEKIELENFRPYPEFCRFIQQLPSTAMNLSNKNQFLARAYNMLHDVQSDPDLLKHVASEIGHAMGHCDDRVQLYFIKAEKMCLEYRILQAVEAGKHDHEVSELVEQGVGMYRLDKIEKMADDIIAKLLQKYLDSGGTELDFNVDDVEVHLGLYVSCSRLLPIKVSAMRFPGLAEGVDWDSVYNIQRRLTDPDNSDFLKFLTSWKPMQQLLHRVDPENYGKISSKIENEQNRIMDAVNDRTVELNRNLAADELPDCKDPKIVELEKEYRNVPSRMALDYLKTFFADHYIHPHLNR